jgi:PAS domain-containing protein
MRPARPQAQSAVQGALAADALATAGDAVSTIDACGKVTSRNAAAEALLRFSRADAAEHGLALVPASGNEQGKARTDA